MSTLDSSSLHHENVVEAIDLLQDEVNKKKKNGAGGGVRRKLSFNFFLVFHRFVE